MRKLTLIAWVLALCSCQETQDSSNDWTVVLKTDKDGTVLSGSKQNLINAIRCGQDLKIGWGAKNERLSIEHLSSPIWLAILSENEVMAHLDPQVLSHIQWDSLNADYKDANLLQQEWRVVLTTKSDFDAVWYDRKADTLMQRRPQKHKMTWFVRGKTPENVGPLFD
ncbi:hypothetical protein [uncultured Allomuricauda sp.]|uniref:hypothetical protein n=1 Tax=Flagellimonas sp. W118 TaxID=3410791 RepID=UPI002639DE8B|nr:hypothetical protein [uncultured Allomuricauda sp.]